MFGDVELGQGRQAPGGPQAVVIAQDSEVQMAAAQGPPQVALHPSQVACAGGDMEGVHHHFGRLIRRQGRQQLPPEPMPGLTGEDVGLELGAQQRPWLAAQAVDHVAEIDPPQRTLLPLAAMESRQRLDELAAQEQIQPVMPQMHRELLADQP